VHCPTLNARLAETPHPAGSQATVAVVRSLHPSRPPTQLPPAASARRPPRRVKTIWSDERRRPAELAATSRAPEPAVSPPSPSRELSWAGRYPSDGCRDPLAAAVDGYGVAFAGRGYYRRDSRRARQLHQSNVGRRSHGVRAQAAADVAAGAERDRQEAAALKAASCIAGVLRGGKCRGGTPMPR
jgi:hypothetical protein